MRVKFFTLGCKVNQYETQGLKEKFSSRGHNEISGEVDLCVINTCTVTSRADKKSREMILRAKKDNPRAKIAVCGCLVQLNRDFIDRIGADYIISQDQKHLLPDIILGAAPAGLDDGSHKDKDDFKITHFSNFRAFVKVQDGCDNFCSFCKIPYLRGRPRSKAINEAIDEVKGVCLSHKEIVLCGVNLSLYGRDLIPGCRLEDLVKGLLDIPSLGRLRLSSLESFSVGRGLFSLLHHPKLCPHFHFPFQSGDDGILKAMNKKETTALYREKVSQIREIAPDAAISCDIMVGFPSENEESFQNTVNFLKAVKPMRIHIFTFSPREETQFAKMEVKNSELIRQRYNFLKALACGFSRQYKKKFLGKVLNMIAEEKNNGFVSGYTENYIRVEAKAKVPLGEIIPVVIENVDKDRVVASVLG